jgi:hypothetical protein
LRVTASQGEDNAKVPPVRNTTYATLFLEFLNQARARLSPYFRPPPGAASPLLPVIMVSNSSQVSLQRAHLGQPLALQDGEMNHAGLVPVTTRWHRREQYVIVTDCGWSCQSTRDPAHHGGCIACLLSQ